MLDNIKIEQNKRDYLAILSKVKRQGIDELISWLNNSNDCDFFIAPSSSVFHGNYKGGLCEHSLNVYKCLLQLVEMYNNLMRSKGKEPLAYTEEQLIVVALLHDLCKVNYYVEKKKYVKDGEGNWQTYLGYGVEDKFPFGHGEKSCFFIQRFMMLSGVEALAIRWHMGYAEDGVHLDFVAKKALNNAWNIAPLAYLLHQADSMSAYLLEDILVLPKN